MVAYGNEYFYGGGIQSTAAGATQYGRPCRVVDLGIMHLPREVFEDYLPDYILSLPSEVMSSPGGAMIMPMIQNLEASLRNNTPPQTTQFVPAPAAVAVPPTVAAASKAQTATAAATSAVAKDSSSKQEAEKKVEKEAQKATTAADPLGSARGKVQEEVMKEFTAIMASGTLRASEAAALAMQRVMERHGNATSMQQA